MSIIKNSQYSFWPLIIFYFLFYSLVTWVNLSHISSQYLNYPQISSSKKSQHQVGNYLSFISFTLKKNNKASLEKTIVSQEILINGVDNAKIKSKLMLFLQIPLKYNHICNLKQVETWVNKMKLSGFFVNVEYFDNTIGQHQIININVKINPVLKNICIIDYNSKVIPYSYILSVFRNQLGYPLNFIKLNKATKLIVQWYYTKGYRAVEVEIVHINQYNKSITINIIEGIIKRIEIRGQIDNNTFINPRSILPIHTVLNIINGSINKAFNVYSIEDRLTKLKKQKIITQGNYEIHKENDSIHLIIYLEPVYTKSIYLFSRTVSITHSILEKLEAFIQYSLNHIIDHSLSRNLLDNHLRLNNMFLQNNSSNNSSTIYANMENDDEDIKSLLYLKLHQNWLKTYKLFLKKIFLISDHNYGFRYNIYNTGIQNNCLLIDSSFPNTGSYFKLQYSKYLVPLLKNIRHQIHYKVFTESTLYFYKNQPLVLRKLNPFQFHFKNSSLFNTSFSIKSNQDINSNINICRQLSFSRIAYQYLYLHHYTDWIDLTSILERTNTNKIYSKLQDIWNYNVGIFIKLQWKITYQNLSSLLIKRNFSLRSVYLLPSHNLYTSNPFCSKYNYSNKVILYFRKSITHYQNSITLSGVIMKLLGAELPLPATGQTLLIGPNIIRGYPEYIFPFPRQFAKISLEYTIPITSHNTLLVFIDYAQGIKSSCQVNADSYDQSHNMLRIIRTDYRLGYGLGLQIQTPIKQIPRLRLEYGYNIHSGQCFHIRTEQTK